VCCSVVQCVAVCCSVLQCVAVCCSVLQCADKFGSVLAVIYTGDRDVFCKDFHRHVQNEWMRIYPWPTLQHTATRCNTLHAHVWLPLQHTATQCNTLQLPVTHCNRLGACVHVSGIMP